MSQLPAGDTPLARHNEVARAGLPTSFQSAAGRGTYVKITAQSRERPDAPEQSRRRRCVQFLATVWADTKASGVPTSWSWDIKVCLSCYSSNVDQGRPFVIGSKSRWSRDQAARGGPSVPCWDCVVTRRLLEHAYVALGGRLG